jgi:hypothetical protein
MSSTLNGISHDAWAASVHRGSALPNPPSRWTVRRKATVVDAVRNGWASIEEICGRYQISVDESSDELAERVNWRDTTIVVAGSDTENQLLQLRLVRRGEEYVEPPVSPRNGRNSPSF